MLERASAASAGAGRLARPRSLNSVEETNSAIGGGGRGRRRQPCAYLQHAKPQGSDKSSPGIAVLLPELMFDTSIIRKAREPNSHVTLRSAGPHSEVWSKANRTSARAAWHRAWQGSIDGWRGRSGLGPEQPLRCRRASVLAPCAQAIPSQSPADPRGPPVGGKLPPRPDMIYANRASKRTPPRSGGLALHAAEQGSGRLSGGPMLMARAGEGVSPPGRSWGWPPRHPHRLEHTPWLNGPRTERVGCQATRLWMTHVRADSAGLMGASLAVGVMGGSLGMVGDRGGGGRRQPWAYLQRAKRFSQRSKKAECL